MPKEKITLLELYKKLKKGDVKLIAEKLEVSQKAVWSVGNGRFENEAIKMAIQKVANKRKEENEKRLKALEQAL